MQAVVRLKSWQRALAALICAALAAVALLSINGAPIEKDAAQNLQMGLTLCHFGVISLDESPPYGQSMYREPLPAATTAAFICIADAVLGPADAAQYFSGERAKYVKYQNVIWLVLLWIAVFVGTRWLTGGFWLAAAAGLVAVRPFLDSAAAEGVNDLFTELPAAALMMIASLCAVVAVSRHKPWLMAATGAAFGMLTLTKAATLYIYFGTVLVLLATYARGTAPPRRARRLGLLALMSGVFLVVVMPWIARNDLVFGKPLISDRGGLVLYTRALLDTVTPLEYRGSFYVWARPRLQPYVGSLLGFSAQDLAPGGRLERLSGGPGTEMYEHDKQAEDEGRPQDAVSFYRKARAERMRLELEFTSRNDPHPDVAADGVLQQEGMRMVEHNLGANTAMVLPLLWRSALVLFPFLGLALLYTLWTRRYALALFMLPSFASLSFYALLTHAEPRPSDIAHPVAIAAFCALLGIAWRASFAKDDPIRKDEIPQERSGD